MSEAIWHREICQSWKRFAQNLLVLLRSGSHRRGPYSASGIAWSRKRPIDHFEFTIFVDENATSIWHDIWWHSTDPDQRNKTLSGVLASRQSGW